MSEPTMKIKEHHNDFVHEDCNEKFNLDEGPYSQCWIYQRDTDNKYYCCVCFEKVEDPFWLTVFMLNIGGNGLPYTHTPS